MLVPGWKQINRVEHCFRDYRALWAAFPSMQGLGISLAETKMQNGTR
jgi:hypothetical protein